MDAEELAGIPVWIEKEIKKRQIPQLYAALASAVQSNAYGSPQAYDSQRSNLIDELRHVNVAELTSAQADFLDSRLKLLSHVGNHGVTELEGILFRNALDITTAASEINRISSQVQEAIERTTQLKSALHGLIEPVQISSEDIQMRIVFDRGAAINNVADFKKWASEWYDICRGISMAVGESPEDVRIVGAQSGSVILTVATTLAIARLVASILLKALEVAEKIQALRKAELEIKSLKLSNDSAAKAIRDQAEAEKKAGLEGISISIKASLSGLDGERVSALEKAIAKILNFVDKGGEIDVVLPTLSEDQAEVPAEVRELKKDVERIRELEGEIKQLPGPSSTP